MIDDSRFMVREALALGVASLRALVEELRRTHPEIVIQPELGSFLRG